MNTTRTACFLLLILFIIAWPSHPAAGASPALQSGELDLEGYCRHLGYEGARLDPTQKNVHGWGCLRSDGTQAGMDLFDLCAWQYGGSLPTPQYRDYDDPYSWYCSGSPAEASSELSLDGGEPCPDADYAELARESGQGMQIYIVGGGVLRKAPFVDAPVVAELPAEDVYGLYISGPSCSAPSNEACDGKPWWKVTVNGVTGWNSDCDPAYEHGYVPEPVLQDQPAQASGTGWTTLINACPVNPLLYEFYKDDSNVLKLVIASPAGFFAVIQNFFDHLGFWLDFGKGAFEPAADEVLATLRYSEAGEYEAQVDRYLGGELLSSDTWPLTEKEFEGLQDKLQACGFES